MSERADRYAIQIDIEDVETGAKLSDQYFHTDSLRLVIDALQRAIEDVENAER